MAPVTIYESDDKLLDLFDKYNTEYFQSRLNDVDVKWSNRLTSCAGTCTYYGKRKTTIINLSLPILRLRSRKDLINILLHEMIHAWVYTTAGKDEPEEHGPNFVKKMDNINQKGRHNITVFHTFDDEVDQLQTHVWKCTGKCTDLAPKYGIVKRSINRPPGPSEQWFMDHKHECKGKFVKVKEPKDRKD